MKALEFYIFHSSIITGSYRKGDITFEQFVKHLGECSSKAFEMAAQELKDAYQHGRDDENCALSDGAMCPDYDNADEWYQGEYGGEQ